MALSDLGRGYRITGQSVEILEIRPQWNDRSVIHQYPIFKATYDVDTKSLEDFLDVCHHSDSGLSTPPFLCEIDDWLERLVSVWYLTMLR